MSETGTEQQQAKFKLINKKTRGKTIRETKTEECHWENLRQSE